MVALPTEWMFMSLRISKLGNSLNPKVWDLHLKMGKTHFSRGRSGFPWGI